MITDGAIVHLSSTTSMTVTGATTAEREEAPEACVQAERNCNGKSKNNNSSTNSTSNNRKHGVKSSPKRNRKRPRGSDDSQLAYTATVHRLDLHPGQLVHTGDAPLTPLNDAYVRVVQPYPYTFRTFAKQRWIGRSLVDVYHSDFGSYPRSYYETAIQQGRILVSDRRVEPSYRIQGHDVLSHTVHRHEPAVAVAPPQSSFPEIDKDDNDNCQCLIPVLEETDDLIIVDKPGTLPIHPCGGYHVNSMTSILEREYFSNHSKLYTIHRLDRLTSGLVILAKSAHVAKEWSDCIQQRECQKLYLARVKGRFPLNLVQRIADHSNGDGRGDNSLERLFQSVPASSQQQERVLRQFPEYGEWPVTLDDDSTSLDRKGKQALTADVLRRRNAHGYWITDVTGTELRNDVADFADNESNVETWLQCLDDIDNPSSQNSSNNRLQYKLQWLHLACPTRVAHPKNGICEAGTFHDLPDDVYAKTVKPSQTSFAVLHYNTQTDSTVILCRPSTGRTHQIRLHCQAMGHAIANDPNYGGDIWYGDLAGQEACRDARDKLHHSNNDVDSTIIPIENGTIAPDSPAHTDNVPASVAEVDQFARMSREDQEPLDDFIRRTCVWCQRIRSCGQTLTEHAMLEYLVRSRGIWLHALQYRIAAADNNTDKNDNKTVPARRYQSFRTQVPTWAVH